MFFDKLFFNILIQFNKIVHVKINLHCADSVCGPNFQSMKLALEVNTYVTEAQCRLCPWGDNCCEIACSLDPA